MAKVLTEEPGRCQISLFDADWPRFLKSNAGLRKTPRLSVISNASSTSDGQTSSSESLAQRIILEKDQEKRTELVNEYVGMSVTEWTGISSPSETDLNKSLYSYGVDSTAALTLKMQLETNLQVSFEVPCLIYLPCAAHPSGFRINVFTGSYIHASFRILLRRESKNSSLMS